MGTQGLADVTATVGPCWSAEKTATVLGHQPEPAEALGLVTSDGVVVYPVSQFIKTDGHTVVAPGIPDMLAALDDHDPWTGAVLLETPAAELDGATPLAWAKQGSDPDTLVDLAQQVAREWSAGSPTNP